MPTSPPKSPHAPQFLKSPQPRQAPRPGRRIRRCGRAVARPAWRALLLAGAVAAMLGLPAVAQAAVSPARAAASASLVLPAATTLPAGRAGPATPPAGPAPPAQRRGHHRRPGPGAAGRPVRRDLLGSGDR